MDTDTLHAHSAGLESWSKQCHTLLNMIMSPKSLNGWKWHWSFLRTMAVGRREWIPSCLASLQISLETDENDGTSSGYFVAGLVSSMIQLRSGWTRHLENLGKRSWIAERRKSVVHESDHSVQERGSGLGENCDSQAWLWELTQTEQRVRSDDWEVVACESFSVL